MPDIQTQPLLHRAQTAFDSSESSHFLIQSRTYTQQYAGIYFSRLILLRPRLLEASREKWCQASSDVSPPFVSKLIDVQPGELCIVVGTVYQDMPLKPNILREISQQNGFTAPPPRVKYTSLEDAVILEDESGRLQLSGEKIKQELLVTGMAVAVLGRETPEGGFEVVDVCYPSILSPPVLRKDQQQEGPWIAIASGLQVGVNSAGDMGLQLLTDFLTGELGSEENQHFVSNISRLVLAGNSLAKQVPVASAEKRTKRFGTDYIPIDTTPLEIMDTYLSQLCSCMPVDMMPGETDPATVSLPQQPIIPAIFSTANTYESFHTTTNPFVFECQGVTFLGSSGQNVDDIFRYVDSENRLDIAEKTLLWGHIAPTAPDTLCCYPYKDDDPFVLKQLPHVYFIGNQPQFETRLLENDNNPTRIILVPSFAESKSFVLVNLKTLDCKCISVG